MHLLRLVGVPVVFNAIKNCSINNLTPYVMETYLVLCYEKNYKYIASKM